MLRRHHMLQSPSHATESSTCYRVHHMLQSPSHATESVTCYKVHHMLQSQAHATESITCYKVRHMLQNPSHATKSGTCYRINHILDCNRNLECYESCCCVQNILLVHILQLAKHHTIWSTTQQTIMCLENTFKCQFIALLMIPIKLNSVLKYIHAWDPWFLFHKRLLHVHTYVHHTHIHTYVHHTHIHTYVHHTHIRTYHECMLLQQQWNLW